MLAFSLLRYWCLRPQTPDPLRIEDHDPLKSRVISSRMEPCDGPQYENTQEWVEIPASLGGARPVQRSVIEIERAVNEGQDMILVVPEAASEIYYHYISTGWLLQENTAFYGSIGLFVSYFCPHKWFIYIPCTFLSLMHSWAYFRVYKYDRLSQYQAYDDDRHPVSNLITAWVLGQRPDHFKYILKKETSIRWSIISETILYSSIISTLYSLYLIEESVVGGRFSTSFRYPTLLSDALYAPAYSSGYFKPAEMVPVAPGVYLPSDIPKVVGWFDLPWFRFRLRPIKYDLAVVICIMGGYFVYKAFDHFFGCLGDDLSTASTDADELGREWSGNEASKREALCKEVNPYWIELKNDDQDVVLGIGMVPSDPSLELKTYEKEEVTRISSQKPYGWKKPGYPENHYGVFM